MKRRDFIKVSTAVLLSTQIPNFSEQAVSVSKRYWNLSDEILLMSPEDVERLGIRDTFLGNSDWTSEQQAAVSEFVQKRLPKLLTEYRERVLFTEVVFNHKTNTVSLVPATFHA